ncbi:hypothetical protein SAMN04489757_14131, partial [Anaerocolumna aminovalerica]
YEKQDRISHRRQSAKNAVSGHDGHHEKMDRAPSGLGTDSLPVGDIL